MSHMEAVRRNMGEVARDLSRAALKHEAIGRAESIAVQLVGVVVADDSQARHVVDLLEVVKQGQRAAKAALDGVLVPQREYAAAARDEFAEINRLLDDADRAGKQALRSFTETREREAAREHAAAAQAARDAAARASAAAQEEIPPMELPPAAPVATRIVGTSGAAVHQRTTLMVEVVNFHDVVAFDPSLVKLNDAQACARFRPHEQDAMLLARPHALGGVVWNGMRFWREKSIARG